MGEVLNVLVAVAVIVVIVRWATSSKDAPAGQSPASVLGFQPKTVTPDMVDTVHNMFPDIPSDNIRYDLLRTGSVQRTSNTIIEKGFLPAPPQPYYTLYPRALDPVPRADVQANPAGASQVKAKGESLISRYNLQERVALATGSSLSAPEEAGGKSVWEDSPEKREASLRERKAQMILAARERLLAQQAAQAAKS
ncbi:predicted protein [Sparassis crispa]|uniref:CUE domain-containing protein n=1 Tax=Sparassis crispa TaxID=139825 RepID=A0A401GPK1_9APHY|nr:predicted protein [Sparassis crispa]GBE84146.1 predicted protein [Sparassis crispa]